MSDPDRIQLQMANSLVSDAVAYAPLIALIGEVPPELAAKLRAAHEAVGYSCSAHSEGMECCLDVLLADPADYAPEKVTAAEEMLARYRASLHAPQG